MRKLILYNFYIMRKLIFVYVLCNEKAISYTLYSTFEVNNDCLALQDPARGSRDQWTLVAVPSINRRTSGKHHLYQLPANQRV